MVRPTRRIARRGRPAPHPSRKGTALSIALILLMLVTTGTAALLSLAVEASEGNTARIDRFEVKRSATSINRLTASEVWNAYRRTLGASETPTMIDLRLHLDSIGLTSQPENAPERTEVVDTLGLALGPDEGFVLGDIRIDSVLVHRIDEPRRTRLEVTTVAIAHFGAADDRWQVTETVTDVFGLEAPRWDGLDFALLASNINCIMCHTHVDDARRIYDTPGFRDFPNFARARVGSIESFQFREDPDSLIAGTLYLGGPAVDEHGDPITDWSSMNLKSAELDAHGHIVEDGAGDVIEVDMEPADPAAPRPYENLYVNYFDFPDDVDGVLPDRFPLPFRDDGGVDTTTGNATPDQGADNRRVDQNEFEATVATFAGSLAGGKIGVTNAGETVTTAARAQQLVDGTESALAAVTRGNVILTGTDTDPIVLDGDVAIDGDLIISGPIKGVGSLWVKGNIYVRSDLEYNDAVVAGERQFGYAADGSQNALGMTAGGNILVGDIYRPEWGSGDAVDGTPSGTSNFTIEQVGIFNRREWLKTQPELPGESERIVTGTSERTREIRRYVTWQEPYAYYAWQDSGEFRTINVTERVQTGTREEAVYEWRTLPALIPPPYGRPRRVRVQTGTRTVPVYENVVIGTRQEPIRERVFQEFRTRTRGAWRSYDPPRFENYTVTHRAWVRPMHPNPGYEGPAYVPRYYSFGEGDPVPIMNGEGHFDPSSQLWIADERAPAWDRDQINLADPNDSSDPYLYPAGKTPAAITTLEPTGSWIEPDVLRGLITDALATRTPDEPLTVDATLYSANSIFGVVPNSAPEGTTGKFRIQGSLLAADVGLLGPGGTDIYFDPRGELVLDIRDAAQLDLEHMGALPTVEY
ncbi:MAG: hypothetical protein AAF957_21530 [Planctomycetota bacterium]